MTNPPVLNVRAIHLQNVFASRKSTVVEQHPQLMQCGHKSNAGKQQQLHQRKEHKNDRRRSRPILEFAQHLPTHDVDWVSLQVGGDVSGELNRLRTHLKTVAAAFRLTTDESAGLPHIEDAGSQFEDFLDTARAITTTDQVITVDTAVAHLAGALGHPTTVLLPDPPDWRWGLNQRAISNGWYSNTQTHFFETFSNVNI
jgi:hypothetical protein